MSSNTSQKSVESERGNFTEGQSWGALRKAWKGYKIAKVQEDTEKMKEYAKKIRTVQGQLGLKISTFPPLDIN